MTGSGIRSAPTIFLNVNMVGKIRLPRPGDESAQVVYFGVFSSTSSESFVKRIAIATLVLIAACSSKECLPEPNRDDTSPDVRVVVEYTAPGSQTPTTHEIAGSDTSAVVVADRTKPLRVRFVAADSSGLRRLAPAVTVQRTVGVGVQREFAPMKEVTLSCPVATLRSEYTAHTSGEPRVLIVSALAENWTDLTASIEPLSIRME